MEVEQQTGLPPTTSTSLHSSPARQQLPSAPHPSSTSAPSSAEPRSEPIPMQTYPPGPSAVCTPPPSSPALGAGPSPRNHFRSETLLEAAAISPTARFYCCGEGKGLELRDEFQGWAGTSTSNGAAAATGQTTCPQGAVLSVSPTSVILDAKPVSGASGGGPLRRQSWVNEGKAKEE
ncbi:hypothetical protein BCR35DRAFT_307794 [Leucosporidium creatinivorum]|uniref:Uncharacterized protein n=1 Tax=Leucosporidium creatinivorum TaxID=106004 RepID=A0A1Y2ELX6_9BASI|nr:hypothetical protein BCR35DRAFT_307794 [Leucosporidium creatinivorum]